MFKHQNQNIAIPQHEVRAMPPFATGLFGLKFVDPARLVCLFRLGKENLSNF
jgi:hypothetical protein